MSLEDLFTILNSTGLPVTYRSWSDDDTERPELPFLTYQVAYTNNFFADSVTYAVVNHIDISLYTAFKDVGSEEALEDVLFENEIPWNKTETYLDEEHCYQIIYEIEV